MKNWENRIKELVKYGFAGGISTLLNLVLFGILEYVGIYYILANWLSYLVAVLFNYRLNKKFVFQITEKDVKDERNRFLRFMIVKLSYLAVDSALFYSFVSIMGWGVYVSRISITAAGIMITYAISKRKVFNR